MPKGAATLVATGISAQQAGRAGDVASAASEKAAQQIRDAGADARRDVLDFFPLAKQDLLAGAGGAFDIFGQGIQGQQQALQQGNINAQQTLGGGFGNVQNALLGLPVNQQLFGPQGVDLPGIPQSPFGATGGFGGGGQIGAERSFTTPQGSFAADTGQQFLNPLAERLNQAGAIIRDPVTGIPSIDFGVSQAPGSASALRPQDSLGGLAFDKAQRQQELLTRERLQRV